MPGARDSGTHTKQEAGWAPEPVRMLSSREKPVSLSENQTVTPWPSGLPKCGHCTAIPAILHILDWKP